MKHKGRHWVELQPERHLLAYCSMYNAFFRDLPVSLALIELHWSGIRQAGRQLVSQKILLNKIF